MKKFFLMILVSTLLYSGEDNNLSFDGLKTSKRIEIKEYSSSLSNKYDNMNIKLDKEYVLGGKINSGELFLEEIDNEYEEEGVKFKISDDFEYLGDSMNNSLNLGVNKIMKSDSNILELGGYGSYNVKKKDEVYHGFSFGIEVNGKNLENGLSFLMLNEYNFEKITKERSVNHILGGVSLKLKKELWSYIYIEPDVRVLYSLGIDNKLKFSDTDVDILSNNKYMFGGRIKLGLENKGDNIFNVYVVAGLDKKINFDEKYLLKFKIEHYTTTVHNNKLDYILGVGGDVVINKSHRFNTSFRTIISDRNTKYLLSLGYSFVK